MSCLSAACHLLKWAATSRQYPRHPYISPIQIYLDIREPRFGPPASGRLSGGCVPFGFNRLLIEIALAEVYASAEEACLVVF